MVKSVAVPAACVTQSRTYQLGPASSMFSLFRSSWARHPDSVHHRDRRGGRRQFLATALEHVCAFGDGSGFRCRLAGELVCLYDTQLYIRHGAGTSVARSTGVDATMFYRFMLPNVLALAALEQVVP